MLYTHTGKDFKQHVHPTLQKRMRIFIVISAISLALVAYDIYSGSLSFLWAAISILVGAIIGVITSRIFHLSWSHDGAHVVGRIDRTGWFVLAAYILFEMARAFLFQSVLHTGSDPTAITFAFVSSALLSRVFGLRGRILRILKEEKVFGA